MGDFSASEIDAAGKWSAGPREETQGSTFEDEVFKDLKAYLDQYNKLHRNPDTPNGYWDDPVYAATFIRLAGPACERMDGYFKMIQQNDSAKRR